MKITTAELVSYLRNAVKVDNKENAEEETGLVEDTAYLGMSDAELEMIIQVAITRDFADYSLSNIPPEAIYPITLISKRDLYFTLATCAAPLYDLKAEGGNELKREQRWQHYYWLISQIDKELQNYYTNGGSSGTNGTLTSYNVQRSDRYNTVYNQRTAIPPAVILSIDNIGSNYVEVSWKPKYHTTDFNRYDVYVSDSGDVFDTYLVDKWRLGEGARRMYAIKDIWQLSCRVIGLEPETMYSIGVIVIANGNKKAYSQELFTTIESENTTTEDTIESGDV